MTGPYCIWTFSIFLFWSVNGSAPVVSAYSWNSEPWIGIWGLLVLRSDSSATVPIGRSDAVSSPPSCRSCQRKFRAGTLATTGSSSMRVATTLTTSSTLRSRRPPTSTAGAEPATWR